MRVTSSARKSEFQDDVTARRNEEMSRLQRTLVEEVRTYAKAQNFDVVLSAEAVLYFDPADRHHAGDSRRAAGARRRRAAGQAGRADAPGHEAADALSARFRTR